MAQAALKVLAENINTLDLRLIKGSEGVAESYSQIKVAWLGAMLISLQLLDGLLTGVGISLFGIAAEGNLALRTMMELVGPYYALAAAKIIAVLLVLALCHLARHIHWVPLALKCVIAVYLVAAIIPWIWLLATTPNLIG